MALQKQVVVLALQGVAPSARVRQPQAREALVSSAALGLRLRVREAGCLEIRTPTTRLDRLQQTQVVDSVSVVQ